MLNEQNSLILIPARLASTRLPKKTLADIAGLPMIVHVLKRAQEANIARVVVACSDQEIKDVVENAGGEAILTAPDLPSGSDRIFEALQKIDPQKTYEYIINVQGDLPTLDPQAIRKAAKVLEDTKADIATLVVPFPANDPDAQNPNVVKAVLADTTAPHRALYFTRACAPHGAKTLFHHVGLYAYTRNALEQFVSLPPSPLEKIEKLEQLRALEAGMKIYVSPLDTVPLGVDTFEDLEKARAVLEN